MGIRYTSGRCMVRYAQVVEHNEVTFLDLSVTVP